MFVRAEYQEIKSRLEEPRRFIQVISGPRQVGKTTVVEQVLSDISIPYHFFSADATVNVNQSWISNIWDSIRNEMDYRKQTDHILVIDEVQKVPNWSEIVKSE